MLMSSSRSRTDWRRSSCKMEVICGLLFLRLLQGLSRYSPAPDRRYQPRNHQPALWLRCRICGRRRRRIAIRIDGWNQAVITQSREFAPYVWLPIGDANSMRFG
jgi:hypothetical protein